MNTHLPRALASSALALGVSISLALGAALVAPGVARAESSSDVIADFENGWYDAGFRPNLRPDGSQFSGGAAFSEAIGGSQGLSQDVTGYQGRYWADSYVTYADEPDTYKGDRAIGNLTSPELTVTKPYFTALVGGGRHPHEPGKSIYLPRGTVVEDFSDWKVPGWTGYGSFTDVRNSTDYLPSQLGHRLDTCLGRCDVETGSIVSPSFPIDHDWISFTLAGGNHPVGQPGATGVELRANGRVVKTATGQNSNLMDWVSWDVSAYRNQWAEIRLIDQNSSSDWGHLAIGPITFGDERQAPWSGETAINVLDSTGEVIGSVTGNNSPTLVPVSVDLHAYLGQKVRIQIVDQASTGPWAHLMADQLAFSDTASG